MIYSLASQELVDSIPHQADYARWRSRLSDAEYQSIFDELNRRLEGDEIATSSWIPGADWRGTVFQPIHEIACNHDADKAALFFGLILWDVMMHRRETWAFGRYEKVGIPIRGLTYFRVDP